MYGAYKNAIVDQLRKDMEKDGTLIRTIQESKCYEWKYDFTTFNLVWDENRRTIKVCASKNIVSRKTHKRKRDSHISVMREIRGHLKRLKENANQYEIAVSELKSTCANLASMTVDPGYYDYEQRKKTAMDIDLPAMPILKDLFAKK